MSKTIKRIIIKSHIKPPVHCMHACIHHQTTCTEYFLAVMSKTIKRIIIKSHVKPKSLTVKSPSFYIPCIDGEPGGGLAVDPVLHHLPEDRPVLLCQAVGAL